MGRFFAPPLDPAEEDPDGSNMEMEWSAIDHDEEEHDGDDMSCEYFDNDVNPEVDNKNNNDDDDDDDGATRSTKSSLLWKDSWKMIPFVGKRAIRSLRGSGRFDDNEDFDDHGDFDDCRDESDGSVPLQAEYHARRDNPTRQSDQSHYQTIVQLFQDQQQRYQQQYQQCQQQIELETEFILQQQRRRRRWRAVAFFLAAFVAIVLKWYAPPPPPSSPPSLLLGDKAPPRPMKYSMSSFSPRDQAGEAASISSSSSLSSSPVQPVEHDSWKSYSRHTMRLVATALHRASWHAWTVASYVLSNAFWYAWLDLRALSHAFFREAGKQLWEMACKAWTLFYANWCKPAFSSAKDTFIQALWEILQKLLPSLVQSHLWGCSWMTTAWDQHLSSNTESNVDSNHHSTISNNIQFQKKDTEIEESFEKNHAQHIKDQVNSPTQTPQQQTHSVIPLCPIRIPAIHNRYIGLPRGVSPIPLNSSDSSNYHLKQMNENHQILPTFTNQPRSNHPFIHSMGMSTQQYLQQTSVSHPPLSVPSTLPQSKAISLLSEAIDSWGQSLVENSDVSFLRDMERWIWLGMTLSWDALHDKVHTAPGDRMGGSSPHPETDGVLMPNDDKRTLVDERIAGFTGNPNKKSQLDDTLQPKWMLPPPMGLLLVGPEGVGKLTTARRLGHWLFGHCANESQTKSHGNVKFDWNSDLFCDTPQMDTFEIGSASTLSNDDCQDQHTSSNDRDCNRNDTHDIVQKELDGILELHIKNYCHSPEGNNSNEQNNPIRRRIVDHIRRRQGFGAVVILHHIEHLPKSILADIVRVLSGQSHFIHYDNEQQQIETNNNDKKDDQIHSQRMVDCRGTLFLLTSKQWGSKSIFRQIQLNGGMAGLRRESLHSSIGREVDSYQDYNIKQLLQHVSTIAPFMPFQKHDLLSILNKNIHLLNLQHQGYQWKRLQVSDATLQHFIGIDHVEYLDLFHDLDMTLDPDEDVPVLTFSSRGGHSLKNNPLWTALQHRVVRGTRRRPHKVAFIDLGSNLETVFLWCEDGEDGLEDCEEVWRSLLD